MEGVMEEIVYSDLIWGAAGLIGGFLIATLIFMINRQKLITQNAELKAQMREREAAFNKAGAELDHRFKATAAEALKQSNEQFLQLAQERLKAAQADGSHDLEKRQKAIDEMVKPVKIQLESLSKSLEQSEGTQKAIREDLLNLNKETAKLAGALRNPNARGNWGEEMLERLLEHSGLMKDVHYELQVALEGARPDAVVNMPDGLHIVIDSKAPINDFVRNLDEDMDSHSYKDLQVNLAAAVKNHIQSLSKKAYWEQLNSPDFVVLFLPSEHLFSAAIQADPSLLDLASKKKIVMVSPTLLMSLLRVVGMSWRQVELAQNAQEISDRGGELYNRLLKFTEHLDKIGGHLQKAMGGYDAAVGSLERQVLPAARKMNELQGMGGADIPEFKSIETQPRALNLTAEDEQEKKRA